ncbi:hypothetical protein RJ639_021349 [Escallonia herrerae]|uniref:NB-ARC domain-containing protein n=1 Tax=Escallonia herrerae TaxID=1293975 RepID=A0AA89AG13_9ASTE|nr:hypothetical protein RJ639_021349 [Escallonia herrerae]
MKTKRKGLSERGIMGAIRKILGKSAPKVNAKRSILITVNKILGYVKCTSLGKIGIYGVGGIGKTSVLKALIDCHEVKTMFDTIILLSVSRLWTRRDIQDEIASHLSINLVGSQSDDHAAAKLLTELTSRKFLLLLDDVRGLIDLDALGVPSKNKKSGSKVVLAARDRDICHAMAVDKAIKMEFLSAEESWTLFHDQVGGIFDSFPQIHPVLKDIVNECSGLPLVLIVSGKALRNHNNPVVLKMTLHEFQSPSEHKTQTNVIQQLKFGYDQLKGADAKECFLFSALYQEGQGIKVSELIRHCMQEGFISGHLADACQRGHDIVESLLDAALLETTDDGLTVTMHEVIRDLALWIISTMPEDSQFMVSKGVKVRRPENKELSVLCSAYAGLKKPPPKNEWERVEKIFLMGNEFSRLHKNANCPQLSMLFLQRNMNLRSIPDSFFEHMPYLQVLNLSQTGIMSLSTSLFKLHKLLVLVLRDCPFLLELPPEIGNLEHLEVLDLQGTEISKLPTEIGTLSALKLLRVSFYGPIDIAENVDLPAEFLQLETISRLLVLKELGIIVRLGDPRWDNCVEPVIAETADMKELTNLHFYFPHADFLDFFVRRNASWNQNCLTKFNFVVGQINNRVVSHLPVEVEFDFDQFDRCLRFLSGDIVPDAVARVLNCATAFYLDHHFTVGSLSKFDVDNMKELKFYVVHECPNMHAIINGMGEVDSLLPSLEHLRLHSLWNLRSLWENSVPSGSFSELKTLSVHTCPKLKYIFTSSMLQHLYNLEELVVEDCGSVSEIIKSEVESYGGTNFSLPELKRMTFKNMPELICIGNGSCPSLQQINIHRCPKLKNLRDFRLAEAIKEIRAEKEWWDALYWEETEQLSRLERHLTPVHHDD